MTRPLPEVDNVEVTAIASVDGMQVRKLPDCVHVLFMNSKKMQNAFLTFDQVRELRGMLDGAL